MKSIKHITGIILAGGKSSRMGQDKGFVQYNGKPFIAHIITALQPLVDDIIIVSNNSDYDQFKTKRVKDIIKNAGPLAGLHSGLFHTKTRNNIVLSCDVPLVSTKLLQKLTQDVPDKIDAVQIMSNGNTNPLIGLYKKRCLNDCLKILESGERRLQTFIRTLHTKTIIVEKPLEKHTTNVNTPNELNLLRHDT